MVMYSVSAFSDLRTSVDSMLVLTSVSTPPLGLSAWPTQCISYPRMENLGVLLKWVSWMQQMSIFGALRNFFVAPLLHSNA